MQFHLHFFFIILKENRLMVKYKFLRKSEVLFMAVEDLCFMMYLICTYGHIDLFYFLRDLLFVCVTHLGNPFISHCCVVRRKRRVCQDVADLSCTCFLELCTSLSALPNLIN